MARRVIAADFEHHLPFGVWMALAKATPVKAHAVMADGLRDQAPLVAEVAEVEASEGSAGLAQS